MQFRHFNHLAVLFLAGLFLLPAALGAAPKFAPRFTPVKIPPHIYGGDWRFFVGGGIATFDCNGDHLPDLFAAGGENPAILLENRSRAHGKVAFVRATPPELALKNVIGAYPVDIDSDGVLDLVVLRDGKNLLLRGRGNCRFAPFTDLGFQTSARWTTAFSATWEGGKTLPTLAFGNYVDRTNKDGPFQACDKNFLYRPKAGTYPLPRALAPAYCPLSMLFSDWNRAGRADLRLSNDRHYYVKNGQEQLWSMASTPPRLYTEADGWRAQMLWGMGIASRDITGDGLPEIFLSSMGDQKFESLAPDAKGPDFRIAPYSQGTTAQRPYTGGDGRPSTGWQISFGDVNNDGRDDVFIAKGNVDQMMGSAMKDPNNLLIQNDNQSFSEAGLSAGIASMARARGAVLADFNHDGRLDLAVVNRRAPLEVYQNITANTGNWLSLRLRQGAPNVNALGAWIEIATGTHVQSREITIGGGHASGRRTAEHFGLGTATKARLRVIWPGGDKSRWVTIDANQSLEITRQNDRLKLAQD